MIENSRSPLENEMQISKRITTEAERMLHFEGVKDLPKQITGSQFFLAKPSDHTVTAYGVITFEGVEYKIGPKVES